MIARVCSFVTLLILLLAFQDSTAQESDTKSNESLIMLEVAQLLQQSRIVGELDVPFTLRANMPDRNRMVVFEQLLEMGKRVKMDGEAHRLQLMIYADNKLQQTGREEAGRTIDGELQLYLSDPQNELADTETLNFSYSDTIHISLKDEVQSDWTPARFHSTDMMDEQSRWRRYGQPAILVAATGVTVFLLFNLRSG